MIKIACVGPHYLTFMYCCRGGSLKYVRWTEGLDCLGRGIGLGYRNSAYSLRPCEAIVESKPIMFGGRGRNRLPQSHLVSICNLSENSVCEPHSASSQIGEIATNSLTGCFQCAHTANHVANIPGNILDPSCLRTEVVNDISNSPDL